MENDNRGKTVSVHVSPPYDVKIQNGLFARAGSEIAHTLGTCRIMIVSDDTVYALYGALLIDSLHAAGMETETFVIPHGESSKSTDSLIRLLNALAEKSFTRTDAICALGGGVVGDLAGFAAAVFLRGIRYVGIPTTVLAAVDSSVGGKTAVDLPAGKNLAGAFHHPSLVLCDPTLLQTLPSDVWADGMAEVIKYAVIGDSPLYEQLAAQPEQPDMEEIIARCVAQKARIVEQDEHDHGIRKYLNYGHTAGHAVEAYSHFQIMHGHGVAIGMVIAARYAAHRGICPPELPESLIRLLTAYRLPTESPYPAEALFASASKDKKRDRDRIDVVLPTAIGSCRTETIPVEELHGFLREGCTP